MSHIYVCDVCGKAYDWDSEIIWITSAFGVCEKCYGKLSEAEKAEIMFDAGDITEEELEEIKAKRSKKNKW